MEGDPWLSGLLAFLALLLLAPVALAEGSLRRDESHLSGRGPWRVRPELLTSAIVSIRLVANLALYSALLFLALGFLPLLWAGLLALAISLGLSGALQTTGFGLGQRHPAGAAAVAYPFLWLLAWALWPWLRVLGVLHRPGPSTEATEGSQEVNGRTGSASEAEEVTSQTQEIVKGVLGLDEMTVREIMVPRVDMVAVETGTSVSEAVDMVLRHGYSRMPLFEGTIDNVVGLVQTKDLLRLYREGRTGVSLQEIARPPAFVPESRKVVELLKDFWEQGIQLALVVDEHGGIEGLVTIEDVLAEISSEMEGEFSPEGVKVTSVGRDDVILDARVSIDYLMNFGLEIGEEEDVDTVGGYVLAHLGRIPKPGDILEKDGVTFSILSTMGRRLGKIRVERRRGGSEEGSGSGP